MHVLSRALLLAGLTITLMLASFGAATAQTTLLCGRCNDTLTPWTYGTRTMTTAGPPSCTIEYTFKYRVTTCGTQDVSILGYRLVHPNHGCLSRPFNPSADLTEIRHDLLLGNPMGFLPDTSLAGCYTIAFFGEKCYTYFPEVINDTTYTDSLVCRDTLVKSCKTDTVINRDTVIYHDSTSLRDTIIYHDCISYITTCQYDSTQVCDTIHKQWIDVDTTIGFIPCAGSGCCAIIYRVCSDSAGHITAVVTNILTLAGDTCSGACRLACPSTRDTFQLSAASHDDPELSMSSPTHTIKDAALPGSPEQVPNGDERVALWNGSRNRTISEAPGAAQLTGSTKP